MADKRPNIPSDLAREFAAKVHADIDKLVDSIENWRTKCMEADMCTIPRLAYENEILYKALKELLRTSKAMTCMIETFGNLTLPAHDRDFKIAIEVATDVLKNVDELQNEISDEEQVVFSPEDPKWEPIWEPTFDEHGKRITLSCAPMPHHRLNMLTGFHKFEGHLEGRVKGLEILPDGTRLIKEFEVTGSTITPKEEGELIG